MVTIILHARQQKRRRCTQQTFWLCGRGRRWDDLGECHWNMYEVKWSEVTQSCLILCDPVDCSLPGSSFHGILQARILEQVTISFSRGSSWPRDQTRVSRIGDRGFNLWATRKRIASLGSMQDTGFLGLVHWDNPERWYRERGGRGVQDWELMYTHGGFMPMNGKTNTVL